MVQKNNNKGKAWWQPALIVFTRMSAWIAMPIILAIFLGKWLDERYGTEPILFLSTVGFAFLISMFGLYKSAVEEYRKIGKEADKKFDKKFDK